MSLYKYYLYLQATSTFDGKMLTNQEWPNEAEIRESGIICEFKILSFIDLNGCVRKADLKTFVVLTKWTMRQYIWFLMCCF